MSKLPFKRASKPFTKDKKLIKEKKPEVVGLFRMTAGGARLIPIDKKGGLDERAIAEGQHGNAKDGDLVRVSTMRHGFTVKVEEVLGNASSEKAVSLIALISRDIPYIFGQKAIDEAKAAQPLTLKGREDMRHIPFMTIDPHDAKDHDDAVYAENSGEGFIIYVAIADVSAYVTPDSALDREALRRGNSVYFPDRVVPMLPEELSTDLCSLIPNVDRPALVCKIHINNEGKKTDHSFHRVMMKSHRKLHYQEAQLLHDEGNIALKPLYQAYYALVKAREKRQPLELDLPERKIILGSNGDIQSVIIPPRLDAHKLIEEMMVLSNVCAAETLEGYKLPVLYRIHDKPSFEKLLHLKDFLVTLDMKLPKAENLRPVNFNGILARVKGTANEELINQTILRAQAQAEYAPDPIGHFGLNLRRYAHFTSPIRRYADLLVHRLLIKAHNFGHDGITDDEMKRLREIGREISDHERRAMGAERETLDRLIAGFLADKIGGIFEARINGVNKAGIFVRLTDTGADGFVPANTMSDDYYQLDEKTRSMVGRKTGYTYKSGGLVSVRLTEAAPLAGALRFEIVEGGERGKPMKRKPVEGKQARPKEIKNKKKR
jgi:ribonuclease R